MFSNDLFADGHVFTLIGYEKMNGQNRKNIKIGSEVYIVLKNDQRTGKRIKGIVKDLLTKKSFHPHGIKVRLQNGQVGRVQEVIKKLRDNK